MSSAEQEIFHNGNDIEIESRFQRRIYIIFNIIRKFECQMIYFLIFQIVIYHIVALIDGINR